MTAVLLGLVFVPSVAFAQDRRVRHVQDDAHLFSKDAIREANVTVDKIHDIHKKDLFIETVAEGPEKAMMTKWARERFNNAKVDGVYVVFSKKPHAFRIVVGDHTLGKYFTQTNIAELEKVIEAKQSADEMLSRVASFTLSAMNEHHKPADAPKKNVAAPVPPQVAQHQPAIEPGPIHHQNSLPPWVGWVCMIGAVLLVVWVVFAIIRAITGMMGGGYGGGGYGMGGGGYGMGGGGGGFFTGMLGGLFGSMAGMWLYNNMFGGHATYGPNGNVNWGGGGGDYGGGDAAGSDADTGVGGTGGGDYGAGDDDAGGAAGGGDAGGGGGDWGGGGDAGGDAGGGGGGDWGGGGDAGGGDWGGGDAGGGGGDWGGGGGGDFGGGGGGGDW
jgi:uncharacterized protein